MVIFKDGYVLQINKTSLNQAYTNEAEVFAFTDFHKRAVIDCSFELVHILVSSTLRVCN